MTDIINNKELYNDLEVLRTVFLQKAAEHFDGSSLKAVQKALKVADEAHAGQNRDDGSPYLFHPLRIAMVCLEDFKQYDVDTICLALLHDTAEDQEWVTAGYLIAEFGNSIASDVLTLTKPEKNGRTRDEINRIYFERLRHANLRCVLVKLLDKLDNVRDVANSDDLHKRQRTAEEAKSFYMKELVMNLTNDEQRKQILRLFDLALNNLEW
ncbi:MAG: guanosine-3',5'-bis(diphosphate) 3'-pyrophosphohydrolase [uncultured bacterium]|nr:MAG: guanosine-3',5'-bis(diphosphate) 3'-pyrophosphohydrolase [uncultured bacterium]